MTETITRCFCDICHKEGAKTYHTLTYRTFDSTDGRRCYNPPQLREERIDLCDDCARKATNIHSIGVQCEDFEICQKGQEARNDGI